MKAFRYLLLVVGCLVGISSCEQNPSKPQPVNPVKLIPKQIIPVRKAVKMYAYEKDIKRKTIEPVLKKKFKDKAFEETHFAWFPLDEMRQYIRFVDAIQKENPEYDVSGIRVYFGRYAPRFPKKNANQQSVFFVPTVSNKGIRSQHTNLHHLPFAITPKSPQNPLKGSFTIIDPLVLDTKDKKQRIKNFLNQQKNQQGASLATILTSMQMEPTKVTSTILNEGELAPPPKKE